SPRQIPNSSGYVHADPVSRSISPFRIASTAQRSFRSSVMRVCRRNPTDSYSAHAIQVGTIRPRAHHVSIALLRDARRRPGRTVDIQALAQVAAAPDRAQCESVGQFRDSNEALELLHVV